MTARMVKKAKTDGLNISIDIDPAYILNKVVKGLSTKEVQQKIIDNVIEKVIVDVADKIMYDKKCKWTPTKAVEKKIKKEAVAVAERHLCGKLKDKVKDVVDDYKISEHVDQYITDMIEGHFAYSPMTLEFKYGKNKKTVDVLSEKKRQ